VIERNKTSEKRREKEKDKDDVSNISNPFV
jgi:hypothetical protein